MPSAYKFVLSDGLDIEQHNRRDARDRAPRGRELSVREASHPEAPSIGPEAGRWPGGVTGRVRALRRRRPWAAERSDGP